MDDLVIPCKRRRTSEHRPHLIEQSMAQIISCRWHDVEEIYRTCGRFFWLAWGSKTLPVAQELIGLEREKILTFPGSSTRKKFTLFLEDPIKLRWIPVRGCQCRDVAEIRANGQWIWSRLAFWGTYVRPNRNWEGKPSKSCIDLSWLRA